MQPNNPTISLFSVLLMTCNTTLYQGQQFVVFAVLSVLSGMHRTTFVLLPNMPRSKLYIVSNLSLMIIIVVQVHFSVSALP